jgi:hypothetical protein
MIYNRMTFSRMAFSRMTIIIIPFGGIKKSDRYQNDNYRNDIQQNDTYKNDIRQNDTYRMTIIIIILKRMALSKIAPSTIAKIMTFGRILKLLISTQFFLNANILNVIWLNVAAP